MKKFTIVCLAFSTLLFLNNNVNGQTHEAGDISIDVGIGFGAYGTSQTSKQSFKATIGGLPVTIYDDERDTTDGAASTVIPINIEYSLSSSIGIGIDFTYNNFLIAAEDKDRLDNVRAYDFGPKFHYHPLSSSLYDLAIGVGLGYSTMKWNYLGYIDPSSGPVSSSSASGGGFYWNLDIKNKFYFGDHFGAFLNLGYKGYSYSKIAQDQSEQEALYNALPGVDNAELISEFKWTMHGANIGVGLAVKF